MAERIERGRDELQPSGRCGRPRRAWSARTARRRSAPAAARARSRSAATARWRALVLARPRQTIAPRRRPWRCRRRPGRRSAHASCSTGMPSHQVIRFQAIAPISAPKITRGSTTSADDDAGADGLRHVQAEEQEGDEVEERRPDHRVLRAQHARRDDGGDRIGGVVQAVEEIERERDGDQARSAAAARARRVHQRAPCRAQTCSITMPLISLATSSKRSTTFSR